MVIIAQDLEGMECSFHSELDNEALSKYMSE